MCISIGMYNVCIWTAHSGMRNRKNGKVRVAPVAAGNVLNWRHVAIGSWTTPAMTPRSIEPGSIQIHQVVEPASGQRKILPRFDATGKIVFCPIHHLTASCSVIPVAPPGTGTQRESLLGRLGRASLAAPSRTACGDAGMGIRLSASPWNRR